MLLQGSPHFPSTALCCVPAVTQMSQKAYSRQGFADSQAANLPFPVFSASGFISPQRQSWFEVPLEPPKCPPTHNSVLAAMGLRTDGTSRQQLPLAPHHFTGEGLTSLFAPIPTSLTYPKKPRLGCGSSSSCLELITQGHVQRHRQCHGALALQKQQPTGAESPAEQ